MYGKKEKQLKTEAEQEQMEKTEPIEDLSYLGFLMFCSVRFLVSFLLIFFPSLRSSAFFSVSAFESGFAPVLQ